MLTIYRVGLSANRTGFPPHGINGSKWKRAIIEPRRMQLCSCGEEARGNWYLCAFWSPCAVASSGTNDAWLEVWSSHSLLRGCWRWERLCAEVLMEHMILKAMAWLFLNKPMDCEQVIYYKRRKPVEVWRQHSPSVIMQPLFEHLDLCSSIILDLTLIFKNSRSLRKHFFS